MGEKRREKQMRRRARLERRKKAHHRASTSLNEQIVPGLGENGQPMRRVLKAGCTCGGDLVFVDSSNRFSTASTGATDTEYVSTWQRRCTNCGDVKDYRDAWVVPMSFTTRSGSLFCELCDTQLTANPGQPPALDGQDWYCPSCEFDGGEAFGPNCSETRTIDGVVEQCALPPGHLGEHGGPKDYDWITPDKFCRAVTKTKDENAVPIRCAGRGGHDGDHYAAGSYGVTGDGKTTHHRYNLRWSTWSPAEERARIGEPAPTMARPPLN